MTCWVKKKASQESIRNDIVFNLEICQLCREIFFAYPSEHTEELKLVCPHASSTRIYTCASVVRPGRRGGDMFPCFLDFLKLIFIGVQLFHNVVLVSGKQQSELAIVCTYIPSFFYFLPF